MAIKKHDLLIRASIEVWFALLTGCYALVSLEVYTELKFNWFLLLLNAGLLLPYLNASLKGRVESDRQKAHQCIRHLLALYICFWALSLFRAIYLSDSAGYEWLDTLTFLFPFTLAATRHRILFIDTFTKRAIQYSLVCSAWLFLNVIFDILPPGMKQVSDDNVLEGVHLPYSVLMFFSVLFILFRNSRFPIYIKYITIFVLLFGMLLEGHRSMLLAALLTIILAKLSTRHILIWAFLAFIGLVTIILFPYFKDGVSAFAADASIESRQYINANRIALALTHLDFGVGIPSKSTSLEYGFEIENENRFQQRVLTVDAGYLDILLRWGVAFGFLFMLALFYISKECRLIATRDKKISLFFISYFPLALTNFSWSIFTWEHGVILVGALVACDIAIKTYPQLKTTPPRHNIGSLWRS